MDADELREGFEKWALEQPVPFDLRRCSGGHYAEGDTWTAWRAYRAAFAAGLERAAVLADKRKCIAAQGIADECRALAREGRG